MNCKLERLRSSSSGFSKARRRLVIDNPSCSCKGKIRSYSTLGCSATRLQVYVHRQLVSCSVLQHRRHALFGHMQRARRLMISRCMYVWYRSPSPQLTYAREPLNVATRVRAHIVYSGYGVHVHTLCCRVRMNCTLRTVQYERTHNAILDAHRQLHACARQSSAPKKQVWQHDVDVTCM